MCLRLPAWHAWLCLIACTPCQPAPALLCQPLLPTTARLLTTHPPRSPSRPACSAYKTLKTIVSRDDDIVNNIGLAIDFGASSFTITDGSTKCSDSGLALTPFDTTGTATCPAGTSGAVHPQSASTATFVKKQCAPCESGYQCAAGVATACAAGKYNELVGAQSPALCVGCPDFTFSQSGECKLAVPARLPVPACLSLLVAACKQPCLHEQLPWPATAVPPPLPNLY